MPAAHDARRAAFAAFVRRAVDHVKQARGWDIDAIVEEAARNGRKLGRTTIYRWLNGDWVEAPRGEQVEAFCDTVDIPTSAALAILWPGKTGRAQVTPPAQLDPDAQELQRRLNDPNVPDAEKYLIRETLKTLAARPVPPKRATGG